MEETMSYTYLNASELCPRFQGAKPGSDEFNSAMVELMAAYAECGIEVHSTDFSSPSGGPSASRLHLRLRALPDVR